MRSTRVAFFVGLAIVAFGAGLLVWFDQGPVETIVVEDPRDTPTSSREARTGAAPAGRAPVLAAPIDFVTVSVRSDPDARGRGVLGLSTADFRKRVRGVFTHNSDSRLPWEEPGHVVVWTDRRTPIVVGATGSPGKTVVPLNGAVTVDVRDATGAACHTATIWCATPDPWRVVTPIARVDGQGRARIHGVAAGCKLRAIAERELASEWLTVGVHSESGVPLTVDEPTVEIVVVDAASEPVTGALIRVRDSERRTIDVCGTDGLGVGTLLRRSVAKEGVEITVDRDGFAPQRVRVAAGAVKGPVVLQRGVHLRCRLTFADGGAVSSGKLLCAGLIDRSGFVANGVGVVRDIRSGRRRVQLLIGQASWERDIDLHEGWNELSWAVPVGTGIQGLVRTEGFDSTAWMVETSEASPTDASRTKTKKVRVLTDEKGKFQVPGLDEGVMYEVRLVDRKTNVAAARKIVRAGSMVEFRLTVADLPACTISGRIRAHDGAIVPGHCTAVGKDGIRRTAPLDRDGNYEIENLLPGPTEIFVEPEGWFGHLRKRVGLQPLERYLHDVALPATGGLEVSIDGVPKAGAKTVGCAIEDQAGVWRGLHRVGTGWGHMDMAPGEYRVKGTGMAPHMTTISVEPGQVARARLRWSAGIDMELTVAGGTGAVRSCMCWLSGESHASVFGGGERTLGFGNPRVWRYRVATGQVYKLQLWSEHDGRQSAVLVTPSGWPAEEVWRPTVLFR